MTNPGREMGPATEQFCRRFVMDEMTKGNGLVRSIDYAWDDNGKNVAIELYERESKTHSKSFERTLRMRKKAGSSCYVEKVLIWENSTSLIAVDR